MQHTFLLPLQPSKYLENVNVLRQLQQPIIVIDFLFMQQNEIKMSHEINE